MVSQKIAFLFIVLCHVVSLDMRDRPSNARSLIMLCSVILKAYFIEFHRICDQTVHW